MMPARRGEVVKPPRTDLENPFISQLLLNLYTPALKFLVMLHSYFMEALLTYLNSPYIILSLLVTILALLGMSIALYSRLNKIFIGANGTSLEPLIKEALERIQALEINDGQLEDHAILLDKRLSSAVRNVSTVRFKAFETGASNQSFAIALLDEKGNGVVLSSLHHRERVTTYAKPVTAYKSSYDLTEEEKQIILDSKNAHAK